jgi:hypothetical protein
MLGVISRDEATFSLDANRDVMNQRRLAITNSLPVTENWTRVAQMAHFLSRIVAIPQSTHQQTRMSEDSVLDRSEGMLDRAST